MLGRSPTKHLAFTQGMDDARPMTAYPGDRPFDVIGLVREWRRREKTPIRWWTPLEFSRAITHRQEVLTVIGGVLDAAEMGFNMPNHGANELRRWRY